MNDAASLIYIGQEVLVSGLALMPVGHARFSYGRGWWDEFWCLDGQGDGMWLSADEGDYALERNLPRDQWPSRGAYSLGSTVTVHGTGYMLTEKQMATCEAVRGEFPEMLSVGETHAYHDFSAAGGLILTYEMWEPDGRTWTIGTWIDPWDVTAR